MRKYTFLILLPLLVFSQPPFSPLGMGFLEMGWRYSGWNPAALKAVAFDGPVFSFSYMSDMRALEFSDFKMGYQSIEGDLAGELAFERIGYSGQSEFSLSYTIAGENEDYYWGLNLDVYRGENLESTLTRYGLKVGVGITGGSGNLRIALSIKDVVIYSSDLSELATGEVGAAIGFVSEKFAIHAGMVTSNFQIYDIYTGIAMGMQPLFIGISFGYATDLRDRNYHFGSGLVWQGKGFFMAVGFDVSRNSIPFGNIPPLPYRFTVSFKLPIGGESE